MNSNYILKSLAPVILALFVSATAFSQVVFKVPPYEKFKLPNGLTVYLMEQHEVPLISISAILPAGAIYDGNQHGLASLTADGLIYGTKNFTKTQIQDQLEFIGASINAFASKEYVTISSRFATKDIDKVLPILDDVMTGPTFPDDEFEKAKKRRLAQLVQGKQSPRQVIGDYWSKFIYGDQVYGNSVNGSPEYVGKFTSADLKAFYKANYAPERSAIAVVGDFNTTIMKLKLNRLFSTWKKTGNTVANPSLQAVTTPSKTRVLLVNKDDAHETTFFIGGMGVKRDNPDYVSIQVVNSLFGGRFLSMLNEELRINTGLTYGASSAFNTLQNSGTFYISTFTATKTTEQAIDKALEVLNNLHKNGIDEKSLISAKNYLKGQFPPGYETSGQLAGLLTNMFWYGFNEAYINNFQSNVDKMDIAKAREIITNYYPKDNLQFVLVGKSADIKKIAEKYGPVTEVQIKSDGFN